MFHPRDMTELEVQHLRSAAADFIRGTTRPLDGAPIEPKSYMMQVGTVLWPDSYALSSDDTAAFGALVAKSRADPMQLAVLMTVEGQGQMMAAARWADSAFPSVKLGHKLAAALASTDVSPEVVVQPPWPAFWIDLPSPMFTTTDRNGRSVPLVGLLVQRHTTEDERWSYIAFVHRSGLMLWEIGKPRALFGTGVFDSDTTERAFPVTTDDLDTRTAKLLARLALGTCLAMSAPGALRPVGRHKPVSAKGPGRNAPEPATRNFQLGTTVSVDCRPAVEAFLAGDRKSLSVQFLVRGHWRNQACGPGHTEHRPTWIAPYWKGPETAPINVKGHVIR